MANDIGQEGLYDGIEPSGDREVFGWHSNSPIFRRLVEETRPKVIFEVGSWLGASAITMAKATREAGLETRIYCVDTWLGAEEFWNKESGTPERDLMLRNGYPQVYFRFLANLVEHGVHDMVVPVPNTSHAGSMILGRRGLHADLIYVDGSHEYEDVRGDIRDYEPLLSPGGVMFGDDVAWDSVRRAVEDSLPGRFAVEDEDFWVFRKGRNSGDSHT